MHYQRKKSGCLWWVLAIAALLILAQVIGSSRNDFDYSKVQDLSGAIEWAKTSYTQIDEDMGKRKSGFNLKSYEKAFSTANNLYKQERYEEARKKYESILKDCPVHLGARNNYILTLAHLGENEASLGNAILLGLLHTDYEGNWVNLLIPLAALGHTRADLRETGLTEPTSFDIDIDSNYFTSYLSEAYAYNRVYGEMEQQLGGEAGVEASMMKYQGILEALQRRSSDDTDYAELLTYLEALHKI